MFTGVPLRGRSCQNSQFLGALRLKPRFSVGDNQYMQPHGRLEVPGHDQPEQDRREAFDPAIIDDVLDTLLGKTPDVHVMAFREDGLVTAMPPIVPVNAEQIVTCVGSALELCMPGDLGAIVQAWDRMQKLRGARARVHLRSDPEHAVTLHFVDARSRFGVYLGFIIGMNGPLVQEQPAVFRPRHCTMLRDEGSVVIGVDEATTKILGWTADELVGNRTIEIIHPDDRNLAVANWMAMLGRPGADHRVVMRYRHRNGDYIWFEITHCNRLSDPAHRDVLSEMLDISERIQAVEDLRASEQLLRRLTETLPLGILQIDAQRRIVYRNERSSAIVARAPAETIDEQLANVAAGDRPALACALEALLGAGESADIELTIVPDGGRRRCSVGMRALSNENGAVTGAIVCISDITERVRMREELERRAKYDNLTRCHNRTSILETLESILKRPESHTTGMAVLFIDLDRFKQVNDRYGHAAGDELLKRTGERLLQCVRSIDIVGRLGGDEFLIVCPDVSSPDGALDIARRIAASLAERVMVGSVSILPGSSIGVAWTNRRIDTDTFVASADAAMYASKRGDHEPVLSLAPTATIEGIATA